MAGRGVKLERDNDPVSWQGGGCEPSSRRPVEAGEDRSIGHWRVKSRLMTWGTRFSDIATAVGFPCHPVSTLTPTPQAAGHHAVSYRSTSNATLHEVWFSPVPTTPTAPVPNIHIPPPDSPLTSRSQPINTQRPLICSRPTYFRSLRSHETHISLIIFLPFQPLQPMSFKHDIRSLGSHKNPINQLRYHPTQYQ